MRHIVLATANPHKLEELRAILAGVVESIVCFSDLPGGRDVAEPLETGTTFAQNAAIKARSYAAQTRQLCLADDSGLEVDALGGAPGVISSHYSTSGQETGLTRAQRDLANNARLLRELAGVSFAHRGARFVCCMCLAAPDGSVLAESRGTFEGRIGLGHSDEAHDSSGHFPQHLVPRGDHGFGYDPLFLVAPTFAKTSAELSASEKSTLSHRGKAARAIADLIRIRDINA